MHKVTAWASCMQLDYCDTCPVHLFPTSNPTTESQEIFMFGDSAIRKLKELNVWQLADSGIEKLRDCKIRGLGNLKEREKDIKRLTVSIVLKGKIPSRSAATADIHMPEAGGNLGYEATSGKLPPLVVAVNLLHESPKDRIVSGGFTLVTASSGL
ncbi:hypothetical protein WN51_14477 [Melipona quadrifasciata]|uniref:Uncharacterized protein n=1 Tax=Melipona quadrifasciata TaxID=166423 RepID=A0A0N0BFJ7_9HYME|nr:hypothetical protein WN51_14477 [Melipona quadrifasciata]